MGDFDGKWQRWQRTQHSNGCSHAESHYPGDLVFAQVILFDRRELMASDRVSVKSYAVPMTTTNRVCYNSNGAHPPPMSPGPHQNTCTTTIAAINKRAKGEQSSSGCSTCMLYVCICMYRSSKIEMELHQAKSSGRASGRWMRFCRFHPQSFCVQKFHRHSIDSSVSPCTSLFKPTSGVMLHVAGFQSLVIATTATSTSTSTPPPPSDHTIVVRCQSIESQSRSVDRWLQCPSSPGLWAY